MSLILGEFATPPISPNPASNDIDVVSSECARAGVHGTNYSGIYGTKRDGAFSICVSGGYRDDKDQGDFL